MIFSRLHGTLTTVSGVASVNTPKYSMGYIRQITLVPTTNTNIYDFTMTDEYGYTILPTEDIGTTAIEGGTSIHKVDIPLIGIYTMTITAATIDENIKYELIIQED